MKLISNFKFQISNLHGFTMIELIVVFLVMAVLSTVGIASFVDYSRAQVLQQAANDLVNTLNTAKTRTVSQNKPIECPSTSVLQSYSVTINTGAGTYSLNVTCSGVTTPLSTTPLTRDVSFNSASDTPPTTTINVIYPVLTGGVRGTGNIVLMSFNKTKTITISSSVGNISVQ
nr:prepilin-type N-terminal cleavage/methylation domain-containing protein [Candidatus Levybacteria bacterium]